MRWLVLLLLVANGAIWYLGIAEPVGGAAQSLGQLPTVASLKPGASGMDSRSCVRLAWFDSEAVAVNQGMEIGQPYTVEHLERDLPALNWVLVRPQPEQQAMMQLRELRALGSEAWLVTQGEHRNGISLGLFESGSAARAVLAQKKRENLDVVLAKFPRNRLGYALVFEVKSEAKSPWLQTVEAEFGKKFEIVEPTTCKGVARPKKSP